MFYQRKILTQLEKELKTKEITVITGMRQVGKTTILNYLYEKIDSDNKALLDLENPLHRKVFEEENFDNIWNNLAEFGISNKRKAYIFLDEIQNLPQVSQAVKYLYDHWQVKFFLTGSSSFYLKNLFPESLAGRKLVFELFPLTFEEFLTFKGIKGIKLTTLAQKAKKKNKIAWEKRRKFYQEYIEFGGFPAVVKEENRLRKKQLLGEIFKSYFEKDVKNLADFKDVSLIRDLILLAIPRVGSKLDISKLASELSVSRESIYNYLAFLEQTYFIYFLPRLNSSVDRQAAGRKKLYFCDTGLANFLGKISLGQLFENSVCQNLYPWYKLCYYQKKAANEIDFIIDQKFGLEVKMSFSPKDLANLKKRSRELNLKSVYLAVLDYSEREEVILATDL